MLRMKAGAELYVKAINAAGGVNGRPIELVTLDDGAIQCATPRTRIP